MFVDPKVIDYFTNEMVLAKVDAEKDTVLAREFHILGYPTLVMIGKDGKEIDRMFYSPPDEFLKQAKEYLQGIGTLDDLLGKAKDSKDRDLFMQIGEKYKYRGGDAGAEEWYTKVVTTGDPLDSMSGQARMEIADMYSRNKAYGKAISAFEAISKDFSGKPTATDADFSIGGVYRRMKDTANAIKAYEGWLQKYPTADTETVNYTKKLIQKLKEPPAPKAEG